MKKRFSEFLADSEVLFFDEGLTLKDGRPTPYFINAGKFNTGEAISTLGSMFADMWMSRELIQKKDIIFGSSYKGSSIACATAIALDKDYGVNVFFEYDRKEEKTHGESSKEKSFLVNKTLFDGCRIFMEDDVITSGATKYEGSEKIYTEAKNKGYDAKIVGLGIAVDREQVGPVYDETKPKDLPNKERVILGERGEDAIGKFTEDTGIPVYSIVGISDVVNHLNKSRHLLLINGERQPMNSKTFNEFNEYMATYGVRR